MKNGAAPIAEGYTSKILFYNDTMPRNYEEAQVKEEAPLVYDVY